MLLHFIFASLVKKISHQHSMNRKQLISSIRSKQSFLCIGLDAELTKIPKHLLDTADPIFEFNKQIIDATRDYCVAYKPNLAFYESQGLKGWRSLQRTVKYIGKSHFTIADAKRGDIGNTGRLYAEAFFKKMSFDAVTVAPYMGSDSVQPFLQYRNKWAVVLALTSNEGSADFQRLTLNKGEKPLFEQVLLTSSQWGDHQNMMYVIGATHPEAFAQVRKIVPNHFLLVPGVGAQGGDLQKICVAGLNKDVGLLVNSSRNIIFAGDGLDFAQKAADAAKKLQQEMEEILRSQKV